MADPAENGQGTIPSGEERSDVYENNTGTNGHTTSDHLAEQPLEGGTNKLDDGSDGNQDLTVTGEEPDNIISAFLPPLDDDEVEPIGDTFELPSLDASHILISEYIPDPSRDEDHKQQNAIPLRIMDPERRRDSMDGSIGSGDLSPDETDQADGGIKKPGKFKNDNSHKERTDAQPTENTKADKEGEDHDDDKADEKTTLIPGVIATEPDEIKCKSSNSSCSSRSTPTPVEDVDAAPEIDKKHDVESVIDKSTYANYLQYLDDTDNEKHKNLNDELHWIVRMDHPCKVEILCTFLVSKGISLSSDDFVGEGSKETALCLAIVKVHNKCADKLIEIGGAELIKKSYESKEYKGATALHLAILKNNRHVTEKILLKLNDNEKNYLLRAEATGSYFENIYKSTCQPLSLAAAIGKMEIFNILVKNNADLWSGDSVTGNTVMHNLAVIASFAPDHATDTMIAILESKEVSEWWERTKKRLYQGESPKELFFGTSLKAGLLKAENNGGYTPLTYAACFGATKFASTILNMDELYKFPQWNIGPTKYILYEMNDLDPAIPAGELPAPPNMDISNATKRASALESFAYILPDERLDFGDLHAIQKAMLNKWNSYRKWFFGWMIIHFIVMVLFTVCVQYRVLPSLTNETNYILNSGTAHVYSDNNLTLSGSDALVDSSLNARDKFILFLECIVLVVATLYFISEIIDFASLMFSKRCSSTGYIKSQRGMIPLYLTIQFDIFRVLLFIFSSSVLVVLFLRVARSPWQDLGYAIAAICGWSFMLFFTTAFQNIGIFSVMLQRMITRELAYFAVVFVFIMTGFGTATYCLFQESIHGAPEEVSSVHHALFSHFRLLVGLEELNIASESRLPWLIKLMFIMFVLLANILLLNMLIAAMNNTYSDLGKKNMKNLLWLRMRTKAVLMIERRLPRSLRSTCNLEHFGRPKQWFIGSEEVRAWHPLAGGIQNPVT